MSWVRLFWRDLRTHELEAVNVLQAGRCEGGASRGVLRGTSDIPGGHVVSERTHALVRPLKLAKTRPRRRLLLPNRLQLQAVDLTPALVDTTTAPAEPHPRSTAPPGRRTTRGRRHPRKQRHRPQRGRSSRVRRPIRDLKTGPPRDRRPGRTIRRRSGWIASRGPGGRSPRADRSLTCSFAPVGSAKN